MLALPRFLSNTFSRPWPTVRRPSPSPSSAPTALTPLHASLTGKGIQVEEMTEAVHVACAIRGGALLAHGVQMRNVAEKLSM